MSIRISNSNCGPTCGICAHTECLFFGVVVSKVSERVHQWLQHVSYNAYVRSTVFSVASTVVQTLLLNVSKSCNICNISLILTHNDGRNGHSMFVAQSTRCWKACMEKLRESSPVRIVN